MIGIKYICNIYEKIFRLAQLTFFYIIRGSTCTEK